MKEGERQRGRERERVIKRERERKVGKERQSVEEKGKEVKARVILTSFVSFQTCIRF